MSIRASGLIELPDDWSSLTDDTINTILRQFDAGVRNEEDFSRRLQDKAHRIGHLIFDHTFTRAKDFKSEARVKQIIKAWLSNAPSACSISVGMDIDRNARLGSGGVRRQSFEIQYKNGTEPERARFAQTETEGHSEPNFSQAARLGGSVGSRKPL